MVKEGVNGNGQAVLPATTVGSVDAAISAVYRAEHGRLVGLATIITGDRGVAEDVVHDAFIRARARWIGLRDPERAAAYVRAAVLNLARTQARRRARRPGLEQRAHERDAAVAGDRSPARAAVADDEQRRVVAAIDALPRRQRDCVLLRFYLDLSGPEIAAALGVSAGAVKTHLHRALERLAVDLEDHRDA